MSTFQRAPFVVFCLVAVLCGGVMIGTQQTPGTGSDRGQFSASSAVDADGGSSSTGVTAVPTRDADDAGGPTASERRRVHPGRTVAPEPSSAPDSSPAGPGVGAGGSPADETSALPSVLPAEQPEDLEEVITPGSPAVPAPGSTPARPTRAPGPTSTPSQGGSQTSDPAGSGSTGGSGGSFPDTEFGDVGSLPTGSASPSGSPSPSNPVNPDGTQSPGPSLIPDPTAPQPVAPEPTAPSAPQPVVPEQTTPADPEPATGGDGAATLPVGSDVAVPRTAARVA